MIRLNRTRPQRAGDRGEAWIAAQLLALLWPRGEPGMKLRVAGAMTLILAAKLIGVGAPLLYKAIVDALSGQADTIAPVMLILAYGLAHAAGEGVGAIRRLLFIRVGQRAIRLTSLKVFNHLHALSLRFHLERQTGGLSRVIHRGTTSLEYLLEIILFNLLPTLLELALVAAILWRLYSGGFALAVVATIIGYAAFTVVMTTRQVRSRREMNERDVAAATKAIDSLINYETVKYFGAEAHEGAQFAQARRAYEEAAVRAERMAALFTLGQAAIIAAGLIAVMVMAGRGVASGVMTVGDFVLVNAYLLQLCVPLGVLGMVYSNVKQALADVEAMGRLLAQPPEIVDRAGAPALAAPRGHVVFEDVVFAYDRRRRILDGVSFAIPPGKTLALVGPSGGGKSTVARLLFRFYDVDAGAIRIDGQDVRDVTQASLRGAIGVVPQDTILFNDSLYYNIAYGRAAPTRDEVEVAAQGASLHDFILRLPDGYETQVGERGLKLSGGEKQRVAIARAILKRPSILIFDEATSALDGRTERDIQDSLRAVSAQRTTLVIAHRLSTIVDADEILVLDAGRIIERGRHRSLLIHNGAYAAMWRHQRQAAERETT